jgi:hypothetical protein
VGIRKLDSSLRGGVGCAFAGGSRPIAIREPNNRFSAHFFYRP